MASAVVLQSKASLEDADATLDDCVPVFLTGNEPITCASIACQNQHGSNLHFYRFPKQPGRCKEWAENCGNGSLLVPDAVPTLFTIRAGAQHLEMDHDYSALAAPDETPRPPGLQGVTKPMIVRVAAPQGISILRAPAVDKPLAQAMSSSTLDESESSANSDSALSKPVAAMKLSPSPKPTISLQQLKALTAIPQQKASSVPQQKAPSVPQQKAPSVPQQKAPTVLQQEVPTVPQQKAPVAVPAPQRKSLLTKRRLAPTPKESPLQKYMLLCAELKGDLKFVQKQKEGLETMFTGLQDVLIQEAKTLRMEDIVLITGALVKFQQERYRREPISSAEKSLSALWLKHTQKGDPSKAMKRPVIEIAVFVFDHTLPGQIILGRRKQLLGGGLYQVPCSEVEFGETWEEAAYREVLESTTIHIRDIAICSIVDTVEPQADYHSVTVFMRGVADTTQTALPTAMQPDRCDSWHWRPWDSLPPPSDLYWPLRDYRLEGLQPFP
ncbi:uncharacterized protein LOC8038536 isoform X2 [Ixodes scapularis]|uniref:uncharacterized protein LOC8038536 isoform X2 n=1 Tax=Ixodes scapularis TaxID=6945 RepID=UPI001A9E0502|nr:uncharacterized protein LOC8038536 isoform X2 [Ixodes scapularis]